MARCHQCQRELPADAVGGICPSCLLGFARADHKPGAKPAAGHTPTMERGSDPRNRDVQYPSIAELNQRLTQFRFFELVGSGGMGAVYKALQINLDRPVAIKIMSPHVANDPSFAERFTREAKTLARLSHHNIVNVYDFGQCDGLYYLVMEYVDGVNLRQAIREKQITPAQALAVVPQVCEALQFAHDEGIIHRDIKPENILLDRRGRVKIADFGLAKLIAHESQPWTLTGSRQVLGTVNYMAPEQIERPTDVDHRADIYSLGVVLYELLTGELPLGRFQLPGEKNAGWAALDEVVVRTLEKQPDRRFQQASEFKIAVEHACSQSGFRPIGPERGDAAPFAAAAATQLKKSDPRGFRVPFTIENPWHGMTVTHGVLKTTPTGVMVDYAKRETVFQSQVGDPGQYEVPFSWILKFDVVEGWFSHQIVMTMESPRDLPGLFTEKPGVFTLKIEATDLEAAMRLANEVRRQIHQPLLPIANKKPEELLQQAKHRLQGPAIAMMFAGALNFIVLPLAIFSFFMASRTTEWRPGTHGHGDGSHEVAPQQSIAKPVPATNQAEADEVVIVAPAVPPLRFQATTQSAPRVPIGIAVVNIGVAVLWVILGGLLISGGMKMTAVKNWGWCLAMSIIALIPIHPGFIIGLPAGICAIVQLSRHSNWEQFKQNQ